MTTVNYATRDRLGEVAFYVLLWKKKGIDLALFDDYWKDVHGPVCARLPGQYQYWQYHVAHNDGGIWPLPGDVLNAASDLEQFDGIAELTFQSVAERQAWFQSAGILMADEYNIFSKAIGYNTSPGNSITYVDQVLDGAPNGPSGLQKYHCLLRKVDGVSVQEFRHFVRNRLVPVLTRSPQVLKCRLHLFDQVDNSRPDAGPVAHLELPEQQYHGAIELAFANTLQLALLLDSPEYQVIAQDLPRYIKNFRPFPERSAYTFVYEGQLTLAGQRSATVADLITRIGAANQLKPDVTTLMLGQQALASSRSLGEKLPGTNADAVKRLFARGEAFDSQGFIDFFTDHPVYQFGNFPVCFDKAAIKASVTAFFGAVSALYHDIKMLWEVGEVVFVEMDVTYWRLDGSEVTLPCADIFRFEGDKVSELRIFMDANPVGDATIPVSPTASVMTLSDQRRYQPVDVMRQFFSDHPDGKQRVTNGFIPKWAIAGPRWPVNFETLASANSAGRNGAILTNEKLPGANADQVKRLFARGEAFDSQGFIDFFTDHPVYQFGNFPVCFDKGAIKASVTAFFGSVNALYHDIKTLWEYGEVVFVEMDVTYWRKDGSQVTLPCFDICRFEGDKLAELRIFMDANPVGNASISVADTASVMVLRDQQKFPSTDLMRVFFREHPDGKERVATGFLPKWAIAGPQWSISSDAISPSSGSDLAVQDKWEQLKGYLKTLRVDQLASLLVTDNARLTPFQ
ncbi:nuclear transport factor 2 family protein [Synechocystis sp. LKSZ1]|uniref:nuclear transport factor 2 family protein n=1 Tax=Synechocystis sp. LKSZ1 TaxID=3144951 RepID=UPI00336BC1C5